MFFLLLPKELDPIGLRGFLLATDSPIPDRIGPLVCDGAESAPAHVRLGKLQVLQASLLITKSREGPRSLH